MTYVRFAFTGELGSSEPGRALDHGILRILWLSADEIRARHAEHRSPLVMQCVDDYLAGRRFPLDLVFTHPSVLGMSATAAPKRSSRSAKRMVTSVNRAASSSACRAASIRRSPRIC